MFETGEFERPKFDCMCHPFFLDLNWMVLTDLFFLKNLNDYVDKLHFKMETLKSSLTIITPDCFFWLYRPETSLFFHSCPC